MSKKVLRLYQTDAINAARAEFLAQHKAVIIFMPTGAGKTVVASELIRLSQAKGSRVIFLAHRKELIQQCSERLADNDIFHGIIKAGVPQTITAKVQVASVQTLVRREFNPPEILFIDECHHARASTYHKIIERCPNSIIIGLTASPCRTDGKGLGDIFNAMVQTINTESLINEGFLVPFRVFSPKNLDMSSVRITGGDYNTHQAEAMVRKSSIYGDIINEWTLRCRNRLTVVFAVSVAHSREIVEAFRGAGVMAAHVDGQTPEPERDRILADLKSGKLQVVSNCGILTEGWDCPPVSCLVVARPTASLAIHLQIVGRGLRTHPGKEDCIILDHAGNHARHGFATDTREWSLEGVKRKSKSDSAKSGPAVRVCPKCYLCMPSITTQCPGCGHQFEIKSRMPDQRKGELHEVTPETPVYRTRLDPLTFYVQKMMVAEAKGYKPGWSKHQFKITFGRWPDFQPEQIEIRRMEISWNPSAS